MTTLYGIKNCDTVRAARRWLDKHEIDYRYHDFREDGLNAKRVAGWIEELGLDKVVNKRSTTWKQLSPEQRDSLDADSAVQLILDNPTLIKRPLLDTGAERHVGFKEADYENIFKHHTL